MAARTYKIGSRKSRLALWQADHVARLLAGCIPGFSHGLETFVTTGDRTLDQPLPEIGGKGLFTGELEAALRDGRIDLVVHSLKDLPVEDAPGLAIAAIPARADARDVLISAGEWTLETLPPGARVGTSSLRRGAQLLHARPDLTLLPLRGNVDTRVRKALEGAYDAIVLAAAGVARLGLGEAVRQVLPLDAMLPAPGQGALAVQCRADDRALRELLARIDHPATHQAVAAERAFLAGLGGGCSAPIAAYGAADGNALILAGLVAALDGERVIRVRGEGPIAAGRELGLELARQALAQGARDLLPAEAAP